MCVITAMIIDVFKVNIVNTDSANTNEALICNSLRLSVSEGDCSLFVVFISTLLFEDHFTDIVGLGIKRPELETTSFSTIS